MTPLVVITVENRLIVATTLLLLLLLLLCFHLLQQRRRLTAFSLVFWMVLSVVVEEAVRNTGQLCACALLRAERVRVKMSD